MSLLVVGQLWGGCHLHGPYDPDATPESIVHDFLVFCTLAKRANTVPQDWDWKAYLKSAPNYIVFAFEKSDAINRWGSENYFNGEMGGRSLRFTGEKIYKVQLISMKTAWSMIKSKKRLMPAK